jgi:PDZ domain-containing protein
LALAVVLALVPLPYYVIRPGPAKDVVPLISIKDHPTYRPSGHLLLTAVLLDHATPYDVLEGWLNRSETVVRDRDLFPPGQTKQQEEQISQSEMDTSKIDAAIVALTKYAGYPERHGPGVLIEEVFGGTPADGKLVAGDVILRLDGKPVDDPDELSRAIRAAGTSRALELTVRGGAETRHVRIVPGHVRGVKRPVIGVSAVRSFPFPLTISSGDIGGPSAGLMWTLGLIELLTPGELTGGRNIAGTGQIFPNGRVGPIGGIEQKVVAAEHAGATVFFAPRRNAAAAMSVANRIRVVPVRSYLDALRFLKRYP